MRVLLPLLLLAGCAATPEQTARTEAAYAREEARLQRDLAGLQPGQPVTCIQPLSKNTQLYGEAIVYRESARRVFLNRPSGGCTGIKRDDILVTRSTTGQVCRGDIVSTVDRFSGFPTGSCTFGDFVPYERPRR